MLEPPFENCEAIIHYKLLDFFVEDYREKVPHLPLGGQMGMLFSGSTRCSNIS